MILAKQNIRLYYITASRKHFIHIASAAFRPFASLFAPCRLHLHAALRISFIPTFFYEFGNSCRGINEYLHNAEVVLGKLQVYILPFIPSIIVPEKSCSSYILISFSSIRPFIPFLLISFIPLGPFPTISLSLSTSVRTLFLCATHHKQRAIVVDYYHYCCCTTGNEFKFSAKVFSGLLLCVYVPFRLERDEGRLNRNQQKIRQMFICIDRTFLGKFGQIIRTGM